MIRYCLGGTCSLAVWHYDVSSEFYDITMFQYYIIILVYSGTTVFVLLVQFLHLFLQWTVKYMSLLSFHSIAATEIAFYFRSHCKILCRDVQHIIHITHSRFFLWSNWKEYIFILKKASWIIVHFRNLYFSG